MIEITDFIENKLGLSSGIQIQIFKSLLIIIIMAVIYRFVVSFLYKFIKNTKVYYRSKKLILYIIVASTIIVIGRMWFSGIQSLTTFLGLFTAGLAIAMKDPILNVAGWAYIVWKRPFRVGDRIEVSGVTGDVIDIELFEFAMMETNNWVDADQSTGRIVYIPNSLIFNEPTFNFSTGIPFIWNEIPIYITHESNWGKAKKLLEDIAKTYGESISLKAEESIKEASKKYMLFNAKLEPTVYTSIDSERSITLTIRYMCSYRKRRDSSEKIFEAVLLEFEKHSDIEFSYPTQRVYDRQRETL